MNTPGWPSFARRYEGIAAVSAPPYRESLIAAFILLLALAAALYALPGRKGRTQALGLVTLRPAHIRSISAHAPRAGILLAGILLGALLAGILIALLGIDASGRSPGVTGFWTEAGLCSSRVLGLFLGSLILQIWIAYSFGEEAELRLWIPGYLLLTVMWSSALLLPLGLTVFVPGSAAAARAMAAVLYIAYRAWVVWRGVTVISRVRRHPLHIIWYLCACEVLPLLFLCPAAP